MTRGDAARLARRNRVRSALCVVVYLVASRIAWPDPSLRAEWHFVLVLTFGYGHLLGSALSPGRGPARAPGGPLRGAATAIAWALVPVAYAILTAAWPGLVLGLLAASIWHTVENDAVFRAWYAGGFRPPPLGGEARRHVAVLGATCGVSALGTRCLATEPGAELGLPLSVEGAALLLRAATLVIAAGLALASRPRTRERRDAAALLGLAIALPWRSAGHLAFAPRFAPPTPSGAGVDLQLGFGDFFAAVTLYHLVSWSVALIDRLRGGAARPGLARRVLVCHAVPVAAAVAAHLAPVSLRAEVLGVLFSPGLYLYYSTLHILQTLRARGTGRR